MPVSLVLNNHPPDWWHDNCSIAGGHRREDNFADCSTFAAATLELRQPARASHVRQRELHNDECRKRRTNTTAELPPIP